MDQTYLRVFELSDTTGLQSLDWFVQLRQSAWEQGDAAKTVSQIIQDVQDQGDEAVVRYMRQWTDPDFDANRIRVTTDELAAALRDLNGELRDAFEKAIEHVRAYQQHIKPADPESLTLGDAQLGLRFTAVSSAGLIVPGGKAAYPSTVIMLAVPAMVAGIPPQSIRVVTPPPTRAKESAGTAPSDVSPLVLAVCALLGIDQVYRIGGAQGVAALALGTQTVEPVDMIVGPGNTYTQLAKLQLNGRVGIDGFYGPSEVLVIADESADPAMIASDLIAQAEHDPGRCFLVAWSGSVIAAVNDQIAKQLEHRARRQAIEASFQQWSAAILVNDEELAVRVADCIAAEHVQLAVANPEVWLQRVQHGGQYFLGDQSPVAAGDYFAGPSHCLPTSTTARFTSGISVYTFLKRSGVIDYRQGISPSVINAVDQLAKAEGLDGHALSMRMRQKK